MSNYRESSEFALARFKHMRTKRFLVKAGICTKREMKELGCEFCKPFHKYVDESYNHIKSLMDPRKPQGKPK